MTYQKPDDPARRTYTDPARPATNQKLNDPMTTTDPPRRRRWGMRVTDPGPRATGDSGFRAAWGIGAFVVVLLIVVAALALWNRSAASSTATGPSTTQSAPNTTGQGGAPANTGPAR
jgi:hypothetical protein